MERVERYQTFRRHKLMPDELKDRFAQLGPQDDVENPIVVTRYYSRYTPWVWYAVAYNASIPNVLWLGGWRRGFTEIFFTQ